MTESAIPIKSEPDTTQNGSFVVEMVHLRKSFDENHVLRDINLVCYKGEIVVILG